jgi:hypothetical protein
MTAAIIAGPIDYELTEEDLAWLDDRRADLFITEVVHTGVGLAVWSAHIWAMAKHLKVISFRDQKHRPSAMVKHVGSTGVLLTFGWDRRVDAVVRAAKAKGLTHIAREDWQD